MSDENIQADSRRQRVQRLKRTIILSLIISIAIPIALSVVLLIRSIMLTDCIQKLTEQVDRLTWTVAEQQEQLEELAEKWNSLKAMEESGTGSTITGEAQNQSVGETIELEGAEIPADSHVQSGAERSVGIPTDEIQAVVEESDRDNRKVYLTFDDGPSMYTTDILDILERYEIKATFFVVGKDSEADKEALRQIVEAGHTLGMHSYSHRYSEIYASVENFATDFEKLRDYLFQVTGVESTVYRFPGGSSNTVSDIPMEEFARYLHEQGIVFYDWNISSNDSGGKLLSVEEIVQNSTARLEEYRNVVILFHDSADKRTTVEALPIIIENILAMEDTVILPITEDTEPVQHIEWMPE